MQEHFSDVDPFLKIHIWDLPNLYVIVNIDIQEKIATFLRNSVLSKVSHRLKISYSVVRAIRKKPAISISVPNLLKLSLAAKLNLVSVEKSIKAVRFSSHGMLEYISFPFIITKYSWRLICHIVGDGTVDKRDSQPALIWAQKRRFQELMRDLLEKISRRPKGNSLRVVYPKGLCYTIMSSIPSLNIEDLKKQKFLKFIFDLPQIYYDLKVQFLAAFLIDDGTASSCISFTQKNKEILESVALICDQLGYIHSPIRPHSNVGAYTFRFYQPGVLRFHHDLEKSASGDSLLGLWHKKNNLELLIKSYDLEKGAALYQAKDLCVAILSILGDHQIRSSNELRLHPKLKETLEDLYPAYLTHRLRYLHRKGFIKRVIKKTNHKVLIKPISWYIPSS
ncbi:MAG: hypothetical protein ACW97X_14055, partial [Candidatus Hodarchaeales archaeon]